MLDDQKYITEREKYTFKFSFFLHSSIKLFWNIFCTGVINSFSIWYSSISSQFPGYTTKTVAEENLIGLWTDNNYYSSRLFSM